MPVYLLNTASQAEIAEHLSRCDTDFDPPLTGRIEINDYAKKIANNATRFEAWSDDTLIGLVAAYCNDLERGIAFITSVSILHEWMNKGIAARLMNQCIEHAKALGMQQVSLEVGEGNTPAIKLYEKNGFSKGKNNAPFISMHLYLRSGSEHE